MMGGVGSSSSLQEMKNEKLKMKNIKVNTPPPLFATLEVLPLRRGRAFCMSDNL
jgi:hypothetical protein